MERRNKARQLQLTKKRDSEFGGRIFKGKDAAPRIVAVVPLCAGVSAAAAVRSLLKSLDISAEVPEAGVFTVWYVVGRRVVVVDEVADLGAVGSTGSSSGFSGSC